MSFDEAVLLKNRIGNTKEINGHIHNVLVVPKNIQEAYSYLSYYTLDPINDENAKKYCSDSNYTVFAVGHGPSGMFFKNLDNEVI
ncbi:MAG TPA: hypothetical protein PKH91_09350 [Flavobacterium sp.]|nr:hypothetical protein [Flavobacterium sp.]